MNDWRERLRLHIAQSGEKQRAVAWRAGISLESLNRIVNGRTQPRFDTLVRIAHAAGVSVGWLLDEPGYAFSEQHKRLLREAAAIIIETTM